MDFGHVGTESFLAMGLGLVLGLAVPLAVALFWKFKKKERFTTILIGAAVFLLFAVTLEKIIQNVLIFPTALGLNDTALSRFVNARPVLLSLIAGLFPGVFEETGRLVAFKSVLRNRKNRETSVSYGIGHGGFEVMFILGITFAEYLVYAVMINNGKYQTIVDEVLAKAPDQVGQVYDAAAQICGFGFAGLGVMVVERIFAVLFHIGASILVFYACKDRKKAWLYPLAIVLHTLLDFIAGMYLFGVIHISEWGLEAIVGVFGLTVFFGAYFLLYRKDR